MNRLPRTFLAFVCASGLYEAVENQPHAELLSHDPMIMRAVSALAASGEAITALRIECRLHNPARRWLAELSIGGAENVAS